MAKSKYRSHSEILTIKQGGLTGIDREPMVTVNILSREKILISNTSDIAHINAQSEGGPRFKSEIEVHNIENLIKLGTDMHRNIDVNHPEDFSEEILKQEKQELENITSDEHVYPHLSTCPCDYIYNKKK